MEQWKVLIQDRLPAYITWDQYLRNQARLKQNQRGWQTPGTVRAGRALLSGLLVCGSCGKRMRVSYHGDGAAHYACDRHLVQATEQRCYGLAAPSIDTLVAEQVLLALEPAALELSMRALEDIEQERSRLDHHWKQQLKRALYEMGLAERRCRAVDPENRLVAATLERRWEEALREERAVRDDYDRFLRETPPRLTEEERARIRSLARDVPGLWESPATTNADRKEIIRCLIDRVVVHVRCDSNIVQAAIEWAGNHSTHHEFVRSVATYAQLQDFEQLMDRVTELRQNGCTAAEIAAELNAAGFRPPKRDGAFTQPVVYQLLKRRGLIGDERAREELLGCDDWWLADLARELRMSHSKLRDWAKKGWVHARQTPVQRYWILWADSDEILRLRSLLAASTRGMNSYPAALTIPKDRTHVL
jgi:hypothetical protein